jgi:hypothetical protein
VIKINRWPAKSGGTANGFVGKILSSFIFLLVGEPISTLLYQGGSIQQKKYKFGLEVCQSN